MARPPTSVDEQVYREAKAAVRHRGISLVEFPGWAGGLGHGASSKQQHAGWPRRGEPVKD